MKLSEYRELLEKRNVIVKALNTHGNSHQADEGLKIALSVIDDLMKKGCKDERRLFRVEEQQLDNSIIAFFKDLPVKITHDAGYGTRRLWIKIGNNEPLLFEGTEDCENHVVHYNLRGYLDERYERVNRETFFAYTGFKDMLWNIIKNNLNKEAEAKIGLIRRKIEQNNKELSELKAPDFLERKIAEVQKDRKENSKALKQLEETLDEIK